MGGRASRGVSVTAPGGGAESLHSQQGPGLRSWGRAQARGAHLQAGAAPSLAFPAGQNLRPPHCPPDWEPGLLRPNRPHRHWLMSSQGTPITEGAQWP